MPEIAEEITFNVPMEKVAFHTSTDGDTLVLGGLGLSDIEAATMAWLVNHSTGAILKVKVKLQGV